MKCNCPVKHHCPYAGVRYAICTNCRGGMHVGRVGIRIYNRVVG